MRQWRHVNRGRICKGGKKELSIAYFNMLHGIRVLGLVYFEASKNKLHIFDKK